MTLAQYPFIQWLLVLWFLILYLAWNVIEV
jgi:hypothetical protein